MIINSPLLGYNSASASDVSGLIYVDRMIMHSNNITDSIKNYTASIYGLT